MKIFVYGTLRRGHGNWEALLARNEGARFVREALTSPGYEMRSLGGYPAVFAREGAGQVVGEIFEVDEATLARLDRLEGHPRWYLRQPVALVDREEGVEIYLMRAEHLNPRCEVVVDGDWNAQCDRDAARWAREDEALDDELSRYHVTGDEDLDVDEEFEDDEDDETEIESEEA
jgi:gamma-glutamylaminecyclotransferase